MKNKIDLLGAVNTIYALSALKAVTNNPELPGPFGRNEEDALLALARRELNNECRELGVEVAPDDSVDLPGANHSLLQAVVTERLIAVLSGRPAKQELHRRLRCRLRPRVTIPKSGY